MNVIDGSVSAVIALRIGNMKTCIYDYVLKGLLIGHIPIEYPAGVFKGHLFHYYAYRPITYFSDPGRLHKGSDQGRSGFVVEHSAEYDVW